MQANLKDAPSLSTVHRPELDGLRAVAICFVLLFHCLEVPQSGDTVWLYRAVALMWSGVDLFFVLSGFLITGILLDTRDDPKRWSTFLARRTLRVFPLYYVWLMIVFWILPRIVSYSIAPPNVQPWCWTYAFNCYIWANDLLPEPGTVNHFWSLAVEEQFYLLWPIVVFFLPVKRIGIVCLLGICLSIALKTYLFFRADIHWMALYTATPLRADALLGGGLVAWMIRNPSARKTRLLHSFLTGVGLLALLALFRLRGLENLFLIDKFTVCFLTSFFALTFPALLQFLINRPKTLLVQFLSWKGFRPIAKLSYGLYVCHYIVFSLLVKSYLDQIVVVAKSSRVPPWLILFVLTVIFSALISMILYHLVERPILSLKRHFSYRQILS